MQNPFVWHDLMTPDVEAAKKFYSDVVGWTFSLQPPSYHVALAGGLGMGGIMATPPELKDMPPFWAGYIYTPDVDEACDKAVSLGGTVCREPWDIPGTLRMAVLADPTGTTFNIMQPFSTEQRDAPKAEALGAVGWNELHAGDLGKAWEFYSKMFGWTKGQTMPMGEAGDYQLFQIGGRDVGGMMKKMDAMPMPVWAYYFNVDSIEAAVARLTKAGGKLAMGPMEVPGGMWIVNAIDPQGAYFNLLSTKK
ncbi:MAG: VOC family protein [Alphaproteobacteria bacterium]|nr:VOC family protein [Alphaproteobacteria bacterium]